MKIVLSGIETNNKGAELMLYAILQEIERVHPEAIVYVPHYAVMQGLSYVKTSLTLKYKPNRWISRIHIPDILRRLHLSYIKYTDAGVVKDADYFIDASGFAFSDQWNPDELRINFWKHQLEGYHKQGTKIIFLPQAFGPIQKENTRTLLHILDRNADIIMPREKTSLAYLKDAGVKEGKVRMYTDFTSLVKGVIPKKHAHLKGAVCIIPNLRMIDKGTINMDDYLKILSSIVELAQSQGRIVYLLNHEGDGDEALAYQCQKQLSQTVEVVTGLNALEAKGLISTAYLCVTSRFHGVASALNTCVPCLATSWSHKYKELFNDYKLQDCVLNLSDQQSIINKVDEYLDEDNNRKIKGHLQEQVPIIQEETKRMWKAVWSL